MSFHDLFEIEGHADRVAVEIAGCEPIVERLDRGEIVDLDLDRVFVRVAVVHRRRRPVVDTELGRDAVLVLEPVIGVHQVVQVLVGEGDMVQAAQIVDVVLDAGQAQHGDPVVLVVIGDEADPLDLKHRLGLEDLLVPV